jgi:hypothetical protein
MVFGSSETGIKIPTEAGYPVMLDQNSVAGLGTHYSGGSAATAWGTNAGR